ncbi:hypothetical protein J6590_087022 [Homalodisca vitripennis]|nr:hypothetical protein J6590_087022 [Homalodisca vitripennis]
MATNNARKLENQRERPGNLLDSIKEKSGTVQFSFEKSLLRSNDHAAETDGVDMGVSGRMHDWNISRLVGQQTSAARTNGNWASQMKQRLLNTESPVERDSHQKQY